MARESLTLKYYRHDDTVLVRPVGPIVESTSSHLIRPILALLKREVRSLVLDLTHTTSIDATGVETLCEANDLLSTLEEPPLRLVVKPNSKVDKALTAMDVRDQFRIHHSVESAWSDTETGASAPSDVQLESKTEDLYLSVSREERGDVVMYVMSGELDLEEVRQFKHVLLRDLEKGKAKIVIDMDQVSFVDSSALGLFASMGKKFRQEGGDLRFSRLSKQAQRVFAVFRLDKVYHTYHTTQGAIDSYEIA